MFDPTDPLEYDDDPTPFWEEDAFSDSSEAADSGPPAWMDEIPAGDDQPAPSTAPGPDPEPKQALPDTPETLRKRILAIPHLISEEQALMRTPEADRKRLQRTTYARKRAALGFMDISPDVKARHNTTRVSSLSEITDPSGVWIVRAPMGSGKTNLIGVPFAQFASRLRARGDGGGRFLAVVHRVTLVEALANKLGTDYYRDKDFRAYAGSAVALSTCLHSVHRFPEFTDEVDCLLIDEASQVLREMSRISKVEGGSPVDVYNTMVRLIQRARHVVLADACMNDATIELLERIRPGEKFNIIDMPCEDLGIDAGFVYGKEAVGQAANSIITMVRDGNPVWVACAERSVANQIQSLVARECPSARIGLFTSQKKPDGSSDFIANISERSREFDCFIHTGAISSGVSVEGEEHFQHVYLITGGYTLNTVDCLQMLRRVRYARSVTVAVRTKTGGDEVKTAAGGRMGELQICGSLDPGLADWRHRCSEAEYQNRRADSYASNLYWALEDSGFSVRRLDDDGPAEDTQTEGKRLAQSWRDGVFSAKRIDAETAAAIRSCDNATDEQLFALERHDIETWAVLRDEPLTDRIYELWDAGRGRSRMERFIEAIYGQTRAGAEFDPGGAAIGLLGRFRVGMFAKLFSGINLLAGTVDPGQAADAIDRICADRFAYAYARAVPSKYGAAYTRSNRGVETFAPFNAPEKPVSAFREVLEGLGIQTRARKTSIGGKQVKNAEITGVSIDADVMKTLQEIAARRIAVNDMYTIVSAPPDMHRTIADIVRDGFDWEAPQEEWKRIRPWEVLKSLSVAVSISNDASMRNEIESRLGSLQDWNTRLGAMLPPFTVSAR